MKDYTFKVANMKKRKSLHFTHIREEILSTCKVIKDLAGLIYGRAKAL